MGLIGVIAMVVGTVAQVAGTLAQGDAAAKEGKNRQLMKEREAAQAERAGISKQQRLKEKGRRLKGQQIVSVAARGGTLSGTSAKAIVETATAIEADSFDIARDTQFRADTLRYEGEWERYRGKLKRRGSRIRALTTVARNVGSFGAIGGFG